MHKLTFVLAGLLLAVPEFGLAAENGLEILPPQIVLSGPHAGQQLVVLDRSSPPFVRDVTAGAKLTSQQPEIARINEQGQLVPVADGTATIEAEFDGRKVTTAVVVKNAQVPERRSFRNDVQVVFTKTGCNTGACHGAQAGKKGFKLALRGYDHEADFNTLTRQARGRRVMLSDPARSLILLKGTGAIPHGGGQRFDTASREYQIVSEWIAQGTPAPGASDATITRLEVFPKQMSLLADAKQQILVRATYTDGTQRDVTRWAIYNSTEVGVATVDPVGQVNVTGRGESALTVWFGSNVAVATVSVPYANQVAPEVFAQSPRVNFVDAIVLDKLAQLQLPPSLPAGDSDFLRRVYLDTLGVLPTVDEARAFLADQNPHKRAALVESLLTRPEYVDYWSYKWSDLLLLNSARLREPAVWAFYSWIRSAVAANKPWNEFAREVVTAKGNTLDNGAANYFVLHKDPQQLNEATSITFLGMSITCARCHDHPLERWTLDDYYGMANLFARVRLKDGDADGESVVFPVTDGNVKHPTRLDPPTPRPLDGKPLDLNDPADRRLQLAAWLTAPENPYFARAIANRVWANYMGRGLVEPVDDLRATNPASNEVLLTALADDFVMNGYNVQHLVRTIANSATYQRSAEALAENSADDRFYSHYLLKRMPAEVLLDALSQVSGVPTEFPNYPKGLRALQLPDSNIESYFLSAFGRPVRDFTCACERSEEPSITQTLHLSNGKTLNDKLKGAGGAIERLLAEQKPDAEIIDTLYLSALSRFPTTAEKTALSTVLTEATRNAPADEQAARAEWRALIEDLYWATVTGKEFLFVH